MFFEMYHHYLKPGGRLVSVIDDGFLNGRSYRWFREMLRKWYVIKAVVSLPGDAFQRSEARVKTSFIVLEKRDPDRATIVDEQPAIFMYACRYVGIDDPKRSRWMPGDDELRDNALEEVRTVVREYREFLGGHGDSRYIVPASRATDQLDVKHCLIDHGWRGLATAPTLADAVSVKTYSPADVVECATHEGFVQLFTVRYDGTPLPGRTILPITETEYEQLYRVRHGDIVLSNIAATYGSVAIVPAELDGLVVSKEYTVLMARPGYDNRVVWALLRSPEVRADMLLRTTGANRTRVRWPDIRNIAFPYPDEATVNRFVRRWEDAQSARELALRESQEAMAELGSVLMLESNQAHHILDAFKPPK